ncbi:hypothetical protein MAQ5080_01842 [Marinomonas aquimarina]|uniref:Oxidoreductase molybdopterin binding domain protein n=1 Tax=Marinomonas aquimarina TaxID=295068 RepID=A0A1A8TF22_9GAMM|nr:hypothetical protein [Marinomonas aquimarina]SBS31059.1 hypothetical protein MAQ5080_01842 [Marinomonas aquimarina]
MKRLFWNTLTMLCATLSMHAMAVLEEPSGNVILAVSGNIEHFNSPQQAQFDFAMLKQLPAYEITTQTPWEEGVHHYVGFDPSDLLEQLEADGNVIRLTAFNQYITEVPLTDFEELGAIIAYQMDGADIPVRNKGPLMVIYDFDQYPELRNETYYGRSIWQIQSMHVLTLGE